jgi:hypothetical protein
MKSTKDASPAQVSKNVQPEEFDLGHSRRHGFDRCWLDVCWRRKTCRSRESVRSESGG